MLGYCLLGTNDLTASAEFYDAIARILGHGRVMESERDLDQPPAERRRLFSMPQTRSRSRRSSSAGSRLSTSLY